MLKTRFIALLFFVMAVCSLSAQTPDYRYYLQNKGEVYFRFQAGSRAMLDDITRIISIDKVTANGEVYAYANAGGFAKFLEKEIAYETLPHPGDSPEAAIMSDYNGKHPLNNWNTYPTYDGYVQMMNDYATTYPNLCQVTQFGTSIQNRKLLMVKITSNVNTTKPRFFYTSSMHGDETGGYVLCLRMIDYLLSNYGTNPRITNLVDNIEIYINPLANPDGTYRGGNNTVNGAIRYNANFIDINRNFPDPADGPHPDGNPWQVETIAFMDLAEAYQFNMSANFHGGAEVVNYPWDTWSRLHPDNNWWVLVANEYADTAQFYSPAGYFDDFGTGITNGYQWYRITGGRQDYMTYFQQGREFTLEISNTKLYPAAQLPNLWEYNYRSMLNYMEQCLYGIHGVVTDSITGIPIKAMVFVKNYDMDSSMVFTRLPYGNYYRPIASGTRTLEYSAPGYVTKTISGIQTSNYTTTTQNVQLRPLGVWADFAASAIQIQPGGTVSFTDLSVGGPTAWEWTFDGGDPGTSALQHPQGIRYDTEGVYDVTLKAQNTSYSNTKTKNNYILVGEQYLMGNQTVTTCSGKFYDNGGPNHPYTHNANQVFTFVPGEAGKRIRLDFQQFELEASTGCEKDYIAIYDGPNTNSPLLGTWCGTNSPGSIAGNHESGKLTVKFVSNPFVSAAGWVANVSCDSGVGLAGRVFPETRVFADPTGNIRILNAPVQASVEIYNPAGLLLYDGITRHSEHTISGLQLPRGIYMVRIRDLREAAVFKILR